MRILLLELDPPADDTLDRALRPLAAGAKIARYRTPRTALRHLAASAAGFDLALVCGDEAAPLHAACAALAACGQRPPLLVLGATASVDVAVRLLQAGADHYLVRDAGGCWAARLPDDVATLLEQNRAGKPEPADAELRDSERRLAQIVDGSSVAMFVIDRQHRITHWNRACAALTGVPAGDVIGTRQQWRAFYPAERPCLADLVVDGVGEDKLSRHYLNKQFHRSRIVDGGYEAQDFFANFGNSGRWLYFTAAPLRNAHGEVVGAIETLQDITEQKRAEENLRQSEERYRVLSITDGMTGLYNARHFAQRLREEMDRCQRYQHPLALMLMDIDDFKRFNDRYGHVEGDQVLIRLSECITACLRRTDQAFRYGGEEFVVLLPETEMDEAVAAAERVRAMFAGTEIRPGDDGSVRCTASIGVTTFVPGETPRDFVARADSGTYEAKRQGKNRVIRIAPGMGNIFD